MSQIGGIGGGSQGAPLANLFVQFSQAGAEALKKIIDDLGAQLRALQGALLSFSGTITIAFEGLAKFIDDLANGIKNLLPDISKLTDIFKNLVQQINIGLTTIIGLLSTFISRGIALSAIGQQLSIIFQQLSLILAGLFAPELRKIIDLLSKLTSWLANLSAVQKANIVFWLEAVVVAGAVGLILPRIIALLTALAGAFRLLSAAIAGTLSATGLGAILPLLGLIAQAIAGLLVGTKSGRQLLGEIADVLRPLVSLFAQLTDLLGGPFLAALDLAVAAVEALLAALQKLLLPLEISLALMAKLTGQKVAPIETYLSLAAAALRIIAGVPLPGGKDISGRDMLNLRGGGFESLNRTWERIAEASMMAIGGKSPAEETNDKLDTIIMIITQAQRDLIGKPLPLISGF